MKPTANRTSRVLHAVACGAWVAVGLVSPWASLAQDRSSAVSAVLLGWGWVAWVAVAVALLVPSAVSLTVVRIVAPAAAVMSFVDARPVAVLVCVFALVVLMSADVADTLVQGGAYGEETRFLLRTPAPYLVPAVLVWSLLAGSVMAGSLLLAARNWTAGVPVAVLAAVLAWRAPVRLHRLSRRWLVIVPAGLVVHDHMVLSETFMVRKDNVAGLWLKDGNGDAADLTGGVMRPRVIIGMNNADKVIVSETTQKFLGTSQALHVQMFAVAPRRAPVAVWTIVNPEG